MAGVILLFFPRAGSREPDVDELLAHVDRLTREFRRQRMRDVRAAAQAPDAAPPAELLPGPAHEKTSIADHKAALRRRVFSQVNRV